MERATDEQMMKRLAEIDADERYHYEDAQIQINAPLALIQVSMKAEAKTLAWALGVECPKSGPKHKKRKD